MDPVTLRTDRLVLSVPTPEDAEDVIAYATDPDVVAFTPVPVPYGHAEAAQWLESVRQGWVDDTRYEFGIRRTSDPRLLGTIGLFGFTDGAAEIGYAVHPDGRGQGFVSEAAERVVAWAFGTRPSGLGLVRVQWRALATNTPSIVVAQRIGMTYEGRRRLGNLHRGQRYDELTAAVLHDDDRRSARGWPAP